MKGPVSSQKEVSAEYTCFHKELYTAEPVDDECMNSFLVGVPKLEPDKAYQCEGDVLYAECW